MEVLRVFDACCVVGRHLKLEADGVHTPEHLLGDLDHFGIGEALVVDSLARESHPAEGNERILRLTTAQPRLHPAWSALPPGAPDEQPSPQVFLDEMRRNGVESLFLYPRQYRFNLSDWCMDALFEPLSAAGIPVFVNFNEIGPEHPSWDETDWESVVGACRRWPSLPLIVSEWRIRRANRIIYRALDACPNLRIETSGYWLHRGLEFITNRWGAGRLIFGSNWPTLAHGPSLTALMCAEISDREKQMIAGDNLRALMPWRRPDSARPPLPPAADAYAAFGRTGVKPNDMHFEDCHGHLGGRACHYHLPNASLDDTVAEMERLGVEKACVFSFGVVFGDECHGNDIVAEAIRRYPERFVGFTGLNPHRGADDMLRELERCAGLGLRGIKLIPHYQGASDRHPLIDLACQWAHEHRQIILNHHWGPSDQMERLLTSYPDACFITGHATTEYTDIMKQFANLFVCSCPLHRPFDCERMVEAIGADRLLFGSDLQDLPIAWGLGPILFARITRDEKRLILGGNIERILAAYSLG